MSKKLWKASHKMKIHSNLYRFEQFIGKKFNFKVSKNYNKILKWSIENSKDFWSSIWDFTSVVGEKKKQV